MRINVDDGIPSVSFRKSEATALMTAHQVCCQLATWLDDEEASTVAGGLTNIISRHIGNGNTAEKEVITDG